MFPGSRNEGLIQNVCRDIPVVFTFIMLVTGLLPLIDRIFFGGVLAIAFADIT